MLLGLSNSSQESHDWRSWRLQMNERRNACRWTYSFNNLWRNLWWIDIVPMCLNCGTNGNKITFLGLSLALKFTLHAKLMVVEDCKCSFWRMFKGRQGFAPFVNSACRFCFVLCANLVVAVYNDASFLMRLKWNSLLRFELDIFTAVCAGVSLVFVTLFAMGFILCFCVVLSRGSGLHICIPVIRARLLICFVVFPAGLYWNVERLYNGYCWALLGVASYIC